MRSRGCGIYLLIYLLVDEGIAKLRYLKLYSTDDKSHQFVLKCPKVSYTRYCIIFYGNYIIICILREVVIFCGNL